MANCIKHYAVTCVLATESQEHRAQQGLKRPQIPTRSMSSVARRASAPRRSAGTVSRIDPTPVSSVSGTGITAISASGSPAPGAGRPPAAGQAELTQMVQSLS